jgi:hypothetical protein
MRAAMYNVAEGFYLATCDGGFVGKADAPTAPDPSRSYL